MVSETTVARHLQKPWHFNLEEQKYFYCDDPACDIMYFGENDFTVSKNRLHTVVGLKENHSEGLIFYCFGVSKRKAVTDPSINNFIKEKTKDGSCACSLRNPFDRRCLKDFS